MLHDPSHKPVIPEEKEIILTQKDKDILKTLGESIAEISSDKKNEENARNWTLLNDKKSGRHAEKDYFSVEPFPGGYGGESLY